MAQQNGPKPDATSDPQYASVDRLAQLTANPAIPRRKPGARVDYNKLASEMKHQDDDLFLLADARHDGVPLAQVEQPKPAQPATKPPLQATSASAKPSDVQTTTNSAPTPDKIEQAVTAGQKSVASPEKPVGAQSWPVTVQKPAPRPLVDDQPAEHQHVMKRSGLSPRFNPVPNFAQVDQAYVAYRNNK
ncbi:hypothetical protein PQ472_04665 [Lacticaseibacillus pabuli]|uniref:Uncharacterized protein n=1 Tax=Lacticaseibacillus pabuli TaxID=3025672 RepID=A0ABY7WUS0_9LACO|nr:hypothetical protein [Lacticaseibacillus sp. KACC 23028]WDF83531.1 hypothetical protein PQ472_04665 [Lacticaseibacillus sp. KACC 23028]